MIVYNTIAHTIGNALRTAYDVNTEVVLASPENLEHGDLTTNVAMQLSKGVGKNPREIAEVIIQCVQDLEEVDHAEIAGPGFVNMTLTVSAKLKQMLHAQHACSPKQAKEGERPVVVEYSQPNIAKPLGVHHILSTTIGQVVSNINAHLGYNVIRVNHLGDWGTQFGKLAVAMEEWGEKPVETYSVDELLDLYVRFHEEAEKNPALEDRARAAFKKLEEGDADIRAFWTAVVDTSVRAINVLYERLHVSFDYVHGESFYEDKMAPILKEGREKGVFVEGKEGALIAEFPEDTHMPPAIVLKADGATIYHTRDLATMDYRVQTWNPQEMLYVVDVAHELYFKQLFHMIGQLGWDLPRTEHVSFGRMSFPDRSMSTRKGNILQLEKALDEAVHRADALIAERGSEIEGEERADLAEMVGVGAFVYTMLSQNRKSNMVFTWEKALTFDGNSGPYVQYTHARARSVLRKSGESDVSVPTDLTMLDAHEVGVVRLLGQFSSVLEDARATSMPHKLTNYLYALCQSYNAFYNALPILNAEEPSRAFRLALTEVVADVIRVGADILTIRVPDRM